MMEYSVEARPRSNHPETGILMAQGAELAEWLNRKAADGWRLVAVREDAYGASEFFFERGPTMEEWTTALHQPLSHDYTSIFEQSEEKLR